MARPVRRSVRVPSCAYGGGLFFVTVCTAGRVPLFGDVEAGHVVLSAIGRLAVEMWRADVLGRADVVEDAFVVMPDHVHVLFGVVAGAGMVAGLGAAGLGAAAGTASCAPTVDRAFGAVVPGTVPAIIRGYKSGVTREARRMMDVPDAVLWQRGYHDRIVRSDREAQAIRLYIANNPMRWTHPNTFWT